ncbi:GDSL-type esterase/lipase family protein [Streptomyces sp. NBC_00250]|uniref:GDSL-type esterase/lipase family protein n=1 Tax=Streptomyces sp. NBC_00250 TaxID=2903641 RepID=UPI002E27E739|nr:GDSL-type esterase/lipase family protein [Streptomyces sp. NBC_00250]
MRTPNRGRGRRGALAALAALTLCTGASEGVSVAATSPPAPPNTQAPSAEQTEPGPGRDRSYVPGADRDRVLGDGWETSKDRAWTTSGDAEGFHVLVADEGAGFGWRTAATLIEPGFDADMWIGNACVTESGKRAVVVYAPRTFTNKGELFDRGGFTAVVDLDTGAIRKLPLQTSLAYYNPGCGLGETAALTQGGSQDKGKTRLVRLDAVTGRLGGRTEVAGQLTSAIPMKDGSYAAADSGRVVGIGTDGSRTTLARTGGIPLRLAQDADGGLVFMDKAKDGKAKISRVAPGAKNTLTLASGPWGELGLARGAHGRAFITGETATAPAKLPAAVQRLAGTPKDAQVSTLGGAVVTRSAWADGKDSRAVAPAPDGGRAVAVDLLVRETGKTASFTVEPEADPGRNGEQGRALSPSLGNASAAPAKSRTSAKSGAPTATAAEAAEGSPSATVEDERFCSVPRNDPRNQAVQPKPRQVEWAVDHAVLGSLNKYVSRPANWKNQGMPAYQPQSLFPPLALEGGGRVPAQVMLGITAQESNMWQASRVAVPGVTSNPLIGNYYGRRLYNREDRDDWDIHWDEADCGYGVTQMTDGMRRAGHAKPGEVLLPYDTQRAVALDYTANISAGLQKLQEKWNETYRAGLKVNNADPSKLENWYFAIWSYNSGFYGNKGCCEPWGVGWTNNPANPEYPSDRRPFMLDTAMDAAHPQDWPYPEKVLGFAASPPSLLESPGKMVAAYRQAWWNTTAAREAVKPPVATFCDERNWCDPTKIPLDQGTNDQYGPCRHQDADGVWDFKCWWNQPVTWKKDCSYSCGNEGMRFDGVLAEEPDGTAYPPACTYGTLPPGTVVVDDVQGQPSARPNCPQPAQGGTFSLDFAPDAKGTYRSKVDFHQIGGGYAGHFWFAHGTTKEDFRVTGTWKPTDAMHGWTRIKVHIPDHGAWNRQADYVIDLGNGQTRHRVVSQGWKAHTWVDLGAFPLDGQASVRLSNVTLDGQGENVAFDAVQFIPTTKPQMSYVALGDSYSAGEGVEKYDGNSDWNNNGAKDACHRSTSGAYSRLIKQPGHTQTVEQESRAGAGTTNFAFIACSGSITTSVADEAVSAPPTAADLARHTDWGTADHHFGEVPQVDQGWIDQDTTLVTISIGGNDSRFTDVLRGCLMTVNDCEGPAYKLTRLNGAVDPEPLVTYEPKVIKEMLPPHLKAVYRAIHARAPQARIVVLGYPQLFDDEPLQGCAGIGVSNQKFMNRLGTDLTDSIRGAVHAVAVEGVDISFVDPTPSWRNHWVCSLSGTEWTNAAVAWSQSGSSGDDKEIPGAGSFHPKAAGHTEFARLINERIAGVS